MERREFLELVGLGAGSMLLLTCLGGCKKDKTTPKLNVDFTLDLGQPANATLNNNGGYLVTNKVIVARTLAGAYIAVAAACTHQGSTVAYQASSHRFHCPSP